MMPLFRFGLLLLLLAVWMGMAFYWIDSLWGIISTTNEQARINFKVMTVGFAVSHLCLHLMLMRIMAKPTGMEKSKSEPPVRLEPHF